jgi:hypothetical protein
MEIIIIMINNTYILNLNFIRLIISIFLSWKSDTTGAVSDVMSGSDGN